MQSSVRDKNEKKNRKRQKKNAAPPSGLFTGIIQSELNVVRSEFAAGFIPK